MPGANGAGCGVGMGSSGRNRIGPGYYSNNLNSLSAARDNSLKPGRGVLKIL
jgi:hypothetical protein